MYPEAELRAKRFHAHLRARFHWARDVYFHLNRHGIRQPIFEEVDLNMMPLTYFRRY